MGDRANTEWGNDPMSENKRRRYLDLRVKESRSLVGDPLPGPGAV